MLRTACHHFIFEVQGSDDNGTERLMNIKQKLKCYKWVLTTAAQLAMVNVGWVQPIRFFILGSDVPILSQNSIHPTVSGSFPSRPPTLRWSELKLQNATSITANELVKGQPGPVVSPSHIWSIGM